MLKRRISQASAATLAAFTITLAGCGREPYPTPSEEPPPPPPPAELMGEPVPPPPPEPYAQAGSAPVVIAMAPIPNPPEPTRRAQPRREQRTYSTAPSYTAPRATAPRASAPRVATPAPAPVKAAPSTAKVTPPPTVTKPGPAKVPPLKAPATPATKTDDSPLSDRSVRLAALEQSLTSVIGRTAKLKAPDSFTVNQPAEVTLTVPAEFAATLQEEAAKNNLADAAATVNLNAILSGDGFAITPDTTQSRPLAAGQATEFKWTVTAQSGQRGKLRADVGADLMGAGSDTLSLGSVQSGGFKFPGGSRTLGYVLLGLIAALVVAFLARGRSGPSRSVSARRDARRARQPRPMNLNENQA